MMTKIMNIHPLELKPGVNPEEFERFVLEEMSQYVTGEGNSMRVLKGVKGNKKDQYVLVFDQDREYYFASEEEQAERHKQNDENHPDNRKIEAKFLTYVVNPFEDGKYTHYNELD